MVHVVNLRFHRLIIIIHMILILYPFEIDFLISLHKLISEYEPYL